jgi:hypothetical protein
MAKVEGEKREKYEETKIRKKRVREYKGKRHQLKRRRRK